MADDDMENGTDAEEINIGFHADGFRIDKTASAMNRYTKWTVDNSNIWSNPEPVCFHSLPTKGWQKSNGFQ